jgi:hypothetical protein
MREKHAEMPHFSAKTRNFTDQIFLRRGAPPRIFTGIAFTILNGARSVLRSFTAMQLRVMRERAPRDEIQGLKFCGLRRADA